MLVGETECVLRQLILPRQRSAEQRRIVGVQRDHHSLIEIAFHRMLRHRLANSGPQIARDADFHRNLPVRQFLDQVRIARGCKAVADAYQYPFMEPRFKA